MSTLVERRVLSLRAADGAVLTGVLFRPAEAPRAGVLLLGATAVPQDYYKGFAGWLAERGYAVLTFDYRGIGRSRRGSLRGSTATMSDWGMRDIPAALSTLADEVPDAPLLGVAHSFGGQALGLSTVLDGLDGVVMVGAQHGWIGLWPTMARWRLTAILGGMFPLLCATVGYVPGRLGLGEDLPPGVALEWARWCRSRGYLLDHVRDAAAHYAAFEGDLLVVATTDDDFAPLAAVDRLASHFRRARVLRLTLEPGDLGVRRIGHFGFFRRAFQDTIWARMEGALAAWADGERVAQAG
ncbi:MAG: alpha/beta fold hydrolase [Alphaproteobacteria bacterium]|nr:alpha/beta fold hydrolase [Alphaproteobacteria bacterium]